MRGFPHAKERCERDNKVVQGCTTRRKRYNSIVFTVTNISQLIVCSFHATVARKLARRGGTPSGIFVFLGGQSTCRHFVLPNASTSKHDRVVPRVV